MIAARSATLVLLGGLTASGLIGARGARAPASSPPLPTRGLCAPIDEISPFARGDEMERASPASHEFYFTRAIYSGGRRGGRFGFGRGGGGWTTDYPKSDRQFMVVLQRLIDIDGCAFEHPVSLADPALRRFPFVYVVEAGRDMDMTAEEVDGLRSYLLAGGMMVADDFWGTYEWEHFEDQIERVFPDRPIVEVPQSDPIFHQVYDIDEILQVPNVRVAQAIQMGYENPPTWEQDGRVAHVRGIYDDAGRLMVVINWNTDLGDAWEWAENPYYPLKYSTFACELGVNMIVYAMSR